MVGSHPYSAFFNAVFQWGHEEETEFPPSQTLVTWEDEEEGDIIPTPLNCTFNWEDGEGSKFPPPFNFAFSWEDDEKSQCPRPFNFTFKWEGEDESEFLPP